MVAPYQGGGNQGGMSATVMCCDCVSAFGQKRTRVDQCRSCDLFDDFVGSKQTRLWDGDAELARRLKVEPRLVSAH